MSIEKVFLNIIAQAIEYKASDLYIIPRRLEYLINCFVTDKIETLMVLDFPQGEQLIRHIKFQSQMNITETRRPQASRMVCQIGEAKYSCRVSCVGDFKGHESVVVRLIYQTHQIAINWVNMNGLQQLKAHIQTRKSGLILLSGKVGAGKTTTLYHAVQATSEGKFVMTIEDPVEIDAPDFLQLQVNMGANMTYGQLMKLALRHHPEILIIGEIRDRETAKAVVEAALSGHLILSTVHADSATGVWHRMIELGVENENLRYVLIGIGYQKLLSSVIPSQAIGDLVYHDASEVIRMIEK
ncbi:Flp pilus assembly complex ATPase component TadA [Weissella diestrammenae]|uniref:Flp pilus assembly complex ATPase component TadA n=1 Tax=Weissella diestrammenae TaxID=1162633 RepID=A0A7G9T4Z7_9LACO|nr:competence type IV pilus ATPase ComGA [Weissella diestrammenae]MCM0582894.1 Flp pilus assembly complex ATPase component TadA [Weissella diestrammenae]QNN75172.1 Flp pilus assembly complex ATPase component TadA [Weissella diestrammenae]